MASSRPPSPVEREPGRGPGDVTLTICSAAGTGRRRRRRRSNTENIAVLTPIPSASDNTATVVRSGLRISERRAYWMSFHMEFRARLAGGSKKQDPPYAV